MLQTWWDECSCPGSERLRGEGRQRWPQGRPPDPAELRRSVQEENEARSEARAAVAARSAGRTRAQLREMFIDELRSRGREIPPGPVLETEVTLIEDTIPPGASILTGMKIFARSLRRIRAIERELAAHTLELQGPRGEVPYLVLGDYSLPLAEVTLDPGAAVRLRPPEKWKFVSLGQDVAGGPAPVVVYADQHRVGVLSARDSQRYQPALQAAGRAGGALFVQCRLSDTPDAPLRLQLHPAGIR